MMGTVEVTMVGSGALVYVGETFVFVPKAEIPAVVAKLSAATVRNVDVVGVPA
jgi:hypothetical protein